MFDIHIFFALIIEITFEIIYNVHPYTILMPIECEVRAQIFSFGSHICSFTSMFFHIFHIYVPLP